jgi:hypothetical protein
MSNLEKLERIITSGAEVRVIFPDGSDIPFIPVVCLKFSGSTLVFIYYDDGYIHESDIQSVDWSEVDVDGTIIFKRADGISLVVEPIYDPDNRAKLDHLVDEVKRGAPSATNDVEGSFHYAGL